MYKVQLTFTPQEANILSQKASEFGYSVTKYIKLLLGREVLDLSEKYPVIKMSKNAEKRAMQALNEYKSGKATEITSFSELDA